MELKQTRSFQHCKSDKNIFCINLPNVCPLCSETLLTCTFIMPPFCVPSPFHYHISTLLKFSFTYSAKPITEYSVVVKPTNGNFLSNYVTDDDLHIGLTTSNGEIYSFAEQGVVKDTDGWDCSLCVPMLTAHDEELMLEWDNQLSKTTNDPNWSKARYDESAYNCYDYVISFLSSVLQLSISKETFCHEHLLPVTERAAKYITLYRDLQKNDVIVKNATDS